LRGNSWLVGGNHDTELTLKKCLTLSNAGRPIIPLCIISLPNRKYWLCGTIVENAINRQSLQRCFGEGTVRTDSMMDGTSWQANRWSYGPESVVP
jgi:hypothetical protein